MPNWVKNNLRIKTNGEKVLEVLEMLKDKSGDMTFEKVAPMPDELQDTKSPVPDDVPQEERNRLAEKYGADNWYDWHCINWGCKWDASESGFYREDGYEMVTFSTPWSPPKTFLKKLSSMFPNIEFEMQFSEEGMLFVGALVAKGGEMRYYIPPDNLEETSDSIWNEEWLNISDWEDATDEN